LEQIEMYGKGVTDRHQRLSLKPAEDLTESEAEELKSTAFLGNPKRMIDPYPRFYELYTRAKRGQPFSPQEIRDLQVWSNLSWMDPRWRRERDSLEGFLKKGSHFTEEEKRQLLQIQLDLLKDLLPAYRALQDSGQAELTTSPWGHPILPLLYDSRAAEKTNPGAALPSPAFRFPEDVAWHLKEAAGLFLQWFGRSPQGLWPSEGSVSQEIVPAVIEAGFRWMATDEAILWKSLKTASLPASFPSRLAQYQPYRVTTKEASLVIVFRDQYLSDRIGFVYQGYPATEAAADFMNRLKEIEASAAPLGISAPLVVVALDGENPWEFYPEDGEPFLRALYQALSEDSAIRCTTISEYLQTYPPQRELPTLAAGSWIRGEFSTWIGHPPQNKAWEELHRARTLVSPSQSRSLAVCEGSDWFWWLGPEHGCAQDPIFEGLFRKNLKAAYRQGGKIPPAQLEEPLKPPLLEPEILPTGPITPLLDGQVSSYFEWLKGGEMDLAFTRSAMARSRAMFTRLWWGHDTDHLYFRLDPASDLSDLDLEIILQEDRFRVNLLIDRGRAKGTILKEGAPAVSCPVAAGKILEMALPWEAAGVSPGGTLSVTISVEEEGRIVERYPEQGTFELGFPIHAQQGQSWSA